jgi:hypothetical protein
MLKYWIIYLGTYLLGGLTWLAIDYAHDTMKKRRRAKILAGRLSLLREFAQKTREA